MSSVPEGYEAATFAGGCFWCVEAVFERVKGVENVVSGYAGGQQKNPTYNQVSMGATDHAEAIQLHYDPAVISYNDLLTIFFATHDPTQLNRQGPDVGKQYRSAVFYHSQEQRDAVEAFIKELENGDKYQEPIVTLVEPLNKFYKAEVYHQDYYQLNPNNSYVVNVAVPKVEKFVKNYPHYLKKEYRE
jgi:peptide-methionine (S)-S-oxide reductase